MSTSTMEPAARPVATKDSAQVARPKTAAESRRASERSPLPPGAESGSEVESVRGPRPDPSPMTLDVRVEYSEPSNYLVPARALADELTEKLGVEPELVPSRGGVFEVSVAGRLIFSKRASHRLPGAR